jgi:uncharacterized protein (TIGR02646 family)
MKYIEKDDKRVSNFITERNAAGLDPITLQTQNLDSKKARSLFDNDVKKLKSYKSLVNSLLEEQGYLCCYCGCRLPLTTVPSLILEHLLPISKPEFSCLLADYKNLLVACDGGMRDPNINRFRGKKRLHCDKHKGDDILPISPLDKDCESHFVYHQDGTVTAANGTKDEKKTLSILNLCDVPSLKEARRAAISVIFDDNDELLPTDDLKKIMKAYQEKDSEGRYEPFSFVVVDVIRQLVSRNPQQAHVE